MAKCNECGYELQGNEASCPKCGCPTEFGGAAAYMDSDVLNNGKSTEAEAIVSGVAELVLKWGKILSILVPICVILGGIIGGAIQLENNNDSGVVTILVGIISAIIYYFLIKLLVQIIWGVIMLFVNMSTTLKRVEILNEQILKEVKK